MKQPTYIIVMDGGLAYDGVYAYKLDADQVHEYLAIEHPEHKFVVSECPQRFSMRNVDRIYDWFRQ